MRKSKFTVKTTALFKKDYKQAMKRGKKLQALSDSTDKELRMAYNLQKMYKAGAFDEK